MRQYGKARHAFARRFLKSGKECPCCVPRFQRAKRGTSYWKRRARNYNKSLCEISYE